MTQDITVPGLSMSASEKEFDWSCTVEKLANTNILKTSYCRPKEVFKVIHSDVVVHYMGCPKEGARYFVRFIDQFLK